MRKASVQSRAVISNDSNASKTIQQTRIDRPETVHRNDIGTIAWNPVSWWLALASLQSVVLEGGSISVKSLSLLIMDGSEPKRLTISDRYLEIWRNGSGCSLITSKRQKWLRCKFKSVWLFTLALADAEHPTHCTTMIVSNEKWFQFTISWISILLADTVK